MRKVYRFLPKSQKTIWGILIIAGLTFNLLMGVVLFTGGKEEEALAVVYAKAQTPVRTETSVEAVSEQDKEDTVLHASAETVQEKQLQQEKQMEAIAAESVAAMQSDLAKETAREENKIQLSEKDKEVLLRIVEAEATGEDITGKMLVANVILNRVNHEAFPDTVEEVVFQKKGNKYQFSPIRDGRYYSVSISETTREAVERVLYGEDLSKGALYFMSRGQASSSNVKWFDRCLTWLLKYGTHEFYK